jgi:hypothetical protein
MVCSFIFFTWPSAEQASPVPQKELVAPAKDDEDGHMSEMKRVSSVRRF